MTGEWGPRAGAETTSRKMSRRFDRDDLPRTASEWAVDPAALRDDTQPNPAAVTLLARRCMASRAGR